MVIKMKIKVHLPTVRSDRDIQANHSSFLCKSNRRAITRLTRSPNQYGEREYLIRTEQTKRKFHDNRYWNNLANNMYRLFVQTTPTSHSNEMTWITFRYRNGDASVMLRKDGSSLYMNGVKKNQVDIAMALARIIAFGGQNRDCEAMENYIDRNVTYSSNILYAIENRCPYWFFKGGVKTNVKINTTLIGRDEVAFEVSEHVWGSLPLDDANTFIDCYRNNAKRSKKWADISPANLWYNMFNRHITEAEETLMKAWLMQNRTSVIVEERAFELLQDMDRNYDEFTLVDLRKPPFSQSSISEKSRKYHFAMHVRGELGDWLVYPNNNSTGTQRCKVLFFNGSMSDIQGPFCIDDINNKNVTGDQIATRAMLLKNDKHAAEMVSTLRNVKKTSFRIPKKDVKNAKFTEKMVWK